MDLLCPVCTEPLHREEGSWRCSASHCFDIARQGYVNLLTVNRKHARHPGDTREQVAARRAFLDGGYYAPIAQRLGQIAAPLHPETVLDVGCGEGYYLSQLRPLLPQAQFAGVDISKDAVRMAPSRDKSTLWLTATAAALPFPDSSFDLVLCMFAMTVAEEFYRVLRPGGSLIQVLAGPDHLLGLKSIIYPELLHKEKTLQPALSGFSLQESQCLSFPFTLEQPEQIRNLLSMTPHYWRISKEGAARLDAAVRLEDRAQVIFNLYQKESAHAG